MADTKQVRFLRPVGHGMVRFGPNAIADLPAAVADRFIKEGKAELIKPKPDAKSGGSKKDGL